MKKTLSIVFAACLMFLAGLQSASADVFYDVTVTYEGGYELSFTMGFADATGNKGIADLLGGDFGEETLTRNDVEIPLFADVPTGGLFFNPSTLQLFFSANDVFKELGAPDGVFGSFQGHQTLSFFEVPGVDTRYPQVSILVERQSDVPLPSTLWMLVAALPALRFGAALRRRAGRAEALHTA